MTNRFMMSVAAAALIAGAGFANAQGTMGKEAPSAGAPAEHSAPSNAPAAKPMAPSGMKATQSEPNAPGGMKSQRAEDNVKGQRPEEKKGQRAEDNMGQKPNNMRSETNEPKTNKGMEAQGREDRGNVNAESKRPEEGRTTGQAGAGAKMSTEQRTKISTVIREQHVAPLNHVNFSISVGTRVPRDVSFHPLPTEIVTIYPEWRGYEYILVGDQIVVVDPRTFEIVAVLDV